MLLMIERPQVRFTEAHCSPQTRTNAGGWVS
jgi:hypothetical protein